jgi:hypothetical protein
MGFSDSVLLAWVIGAGVAAVFVAGYLALGWLTDQPGVAERFGPAIGCHYILLGLVLGLFFVPTALAVALGLAGIDHSVPIALVTTVFAGVTALVGSSVFDELSDSFLWLAIAVVAIAVGFETVVAMLLVDGIAGLVSSVVAQR